MAFSPKDTLQGRAVGVPTMGFVTTMDVSCWSFIRMAQLAHKGADGRRILLAKGAPEVRPSCQTTTIA